MTRPLLALLVVWVAMLVVAPAGLAAPDPCKPKPNNPDPCGQIPEAPVSLLIPLVGAAVVLAFVAVEARRRRRAGSLAEL